MFTVSTERNKDSNQKVIWCKKKIKKWVYTVLSANTLKWSNKKEDQETSIWFKTFFTLLLVFDWYIH